MQFLVIGHDGTDVDAPGRRQAVRQRHLALSDQLLESGNLLFGAALVNDKEEIIGSSMVVDFSSKDELDEWLKVEPYITGDVWRVVTAEPCRISPSFAPLLMKE